MARPLRRSAARPAVHRGVLQSRAPLADESTSVVRAARWGSYASVDKRSGVYFKRKLVSILTTLRGFDEDRGPATAVASYGLL